MSLKLIKDIVSKSIFKVPFVYNPAAKSFVNHKAKYKTPNKINDKKYIKNNGSYIFRQL